MTAIPTDADLEMAELAEQGDLIASGVCWICEDVLDPADPRWAETVSPRTRQADGTCRAAPSAEYAEALGPVDPQLKAHVWCLDDRGVEHG